MEIIRNNHQKQSSKHDIALICFALCFVLVGGIGYLFDQTWLMVFPVFAIALVILVHPFWGLLLFAALLPLESSFLSLGGDFGTVTRYLGIYIFGVWFIQTRIENEKWRLPSVLIFALLLVFWGGISVLWALNRSVTLGRIQTAVQLFMLLVLVINFVTDQKKLKALLGALFIGCFIVTIMGLFGIGVAEYGFLLTLDDQGAKEYGSYVGLVFLIGSILFFFQKGKQRWLGFILTLLPITSLIRINQRGVLFGIGVAWLSMTVITRQKLKTILLIIAIIFLFGFAVNYLHQQGVIDELLAERLTVENLIETGGTGRSEIWSTGWRMIKDNFIHGVGWANYPVAYDKYVQRGENSSISFGYVQKDPHNDLIGLAGELGIVGAVLFLFLIGHIFMKNFSFLRQLKNNQENIAALLVYCLLIYVFAIGLTSTFLWRKVYWLVLGLAISSPIVFKIKDKGKEKNLKGVV